MRARDLTKGFGPVGTNAPIADAVERKPVGVLVVMEAAAYELHDYTPGAPQPMAEARAAVAELIAADREYDFAKARRIEADNIIARGDRSDDAFRRQALAHHAYDRAVDRRSTALARVGGAA